MQEITPAVMLKCRSCEQRAAYRIKGKAMAKNRKKPTLRILVAILMLLVFSGFYFLLAPYIHQEVGEGNVETSASLPVQEQTHETADKSSEYLILVNKTHGLDKDYEPDDLQTVNSVAEDREKEYQKLRSAAAKAFNKLTAAAKKKGYTIKLTSAFRPYSYQEVLYEKYIEEDGKNKAEQYSAKPGYSEHQTGLAADVSSPSINYDLAQAYGSTEEGQWLAKNAHKYGFIIRYPEGKEDITGYEYEPWHIRYVGKDAAREIYRQKTTLEEYLGAV